ncbi:MAG: ABC transporter permease, partial [Longimicrobiales bacterium]
RQDVRFALRTLMRSPSFTLTAVCTLALAIAITTALVAVVDATLLRPLPFADADRLVVLNGVAGPDRDVRGGSFAEVRDWGETTSSFTAVSIQDVAAYNLSDGAGAEQVTGEMVSPSYFTMLELQPRIGRLLEPSDNVVGAAPVVLISHDLWQRHYGGARDVVGRGVRIDGTSATIVGVLQPGFRGQSMESDLWMTLPPFMPDAVDERGGRWLGALARLAPGVTHAAAQADLERATEQLELLYPESNTERRADVVALRDSFLTGARALDDTRTLLLTVAGAVGMLLLIACVNVTNLQLVRGLTRGGEVAVRYALGAGRTRIVRQLMTEALVLALIGGIVGIALAAIATRSVVALLPADVLPPYAMVQIDGRVIAVGLLLVAIAGALSGLIPALRSTRTGLAADLRGFDCTAGSGGRRARLQRALVAAEVALALSLMASAALMIRSLQAQLAIDAGFDAHNVTVGRVMLLGDEYDAAARLRFAAAVVEHLGRQPDVAGVAITTDAPLRGSSSASILRLPDRPDHGVRYYRHIVTPEFFDVLGVDILRGRAFTAADHEDAPPVVIVSEAFAARLFPDGDAVGRTVLFSPRDTVTIVGIAANVRQRDLTTSLFDPGEDPDVYFALAQLPRSGLDIVVRGERGLIPAERIHDAVRAAAPAIPLFRVEPLQSAIDTQTANARFGSLLLTALGIL